MNKLPGEGAPAVVVPEMVPEVVHKVGPGLAQSHSTHGVPADQSASHHLTLVLLIFHRPSTQRLGVLYQERGRLLQGTWLEDLGHEISGQA